MKMRILLAFSASVVLAGPAAAQNYNANSTYANPDSTTTQIYQTQRKICGDPWVTIALNQVFGNGFDPVHCDIRNFNNGTWRDYNELIHAVGRYRNDITNARLGFFAAQINGQSKIIVAKGNVAMGTLNPSDLGLVSQGGTRIVAAGGGNIVAAGGGNIVAAGGGNIVAAGGGNLVNTQGQRIVAAGGGNVITGLPTANIGARATMAGESARVGSRVISGLR